MAYENSDSKFSKSKEIHDFKRLRCTSHVCTCAKFPAMSLFLALISFTLFLLSFLIFCSIVSVIFECVIGCRSLKSQKSVVAK